jgi:phosphoribosylformylglycinamidine synthase
MTVKIIVTLKPSVLDPQGKTVSRSLAELGFGEVQDVRVGRYIELQVDERSHGTPEQLAARVDEMCRRLLTNPVIESYRVEFPPPAPQPTSPASR